MTFPPPEDFPFFDRVSTSFISFNTHSYPRVGFLTRPYPGHLSHDANCPVISVSEQRANGTCASPQRYAQHLFAGVGHAAALVLAQVEEATLVLLVLVVLEVVGVGVGVLVGAAVAVGHFWH